MQLAHREGDGATLREHLQRLAGNTGRVDPRLRGGVPKAAENVWQLYTALGIQRRSGMGMHPLTFSDIEAWCRLYGVQLNPWELDTILELDAASLRMAARAQRQAAAATSKT